LINSIGFDRAGSDKLIKVIDVQCLMASLAGFAPQLFKASREKWWEKHYVASSPEIRWYFRWVS